jgi:hypothetical protein
MFYFYAELLKRKLKVLEGRAEVSKFVCCFVVLNCVASWSQISVSIKLLFPSYSLFGTRFRAVAKQMRRDCWVCTVCGNGLDDRVSISDRDKGFSVSPCVHTGSGAHQASRPVGTRGHFPGGKTRLGREADHSPHLVQKLRVGAMRPLPSPPGASMMCWGIGLLYFEM